MKKLLFISFLLIVIGGCGPRLIYPHLNWLIPWYVSDYISLDHTQKSMLQKRLLKQLDWHCRTQMPAYAEVLRASGQEFADPVQRMDYAKIRFYNQKLIELWGELMKQIGPDIADILLTASDEQIGELFENLAKQNQDFRKEYVDPPPRQLIEKRQNRMSKRLKYWISDLTAEQKEAVSLWSTQLVPLAEDWLQNREMIQAEARRLLSQRHSNPEFRASLMELIVNPERLGTPAYRDKIDKNIEITIRFIIQLDQTLTQQQRSKLLNRIESLAADLDKLSCDPKDIPRPDAGGRY
jgi:hypothetical protein